MKYFVLLAGIVFSTLPCLAIDHSAFQKDVNTVSVEKLEFWKNQLEIRLTYLRNRPQVINSYILGVKPDPKNSEIPELIRSLKANSEKYENTIPEMVSARCTDYYRMSVELGQLLLNSIEVIQSPTSSDREKALARVHLQLGSDRMTSHEGLFFRSGEGGIAGEGAEKTQCACEIRSQIGEMITERQKLVQEIKTLLLGEAGAWDVLPRTTEIAELLRMDLEELRNDIYVSTAVGIGFVLLWEVAAVGYMAGLVKAGKITHRTKTVVEWSTLAGFLVLGVASMDWDEMTEPIPSDDVHQDTENILYWSNWSKQMESTQMLVNDIPNSVNDIYSLIYQYEVKKHIRMMRNNPRKKLDPIMDALNNKWGGAAEQVLEERLAMVEAAISSRQRISCN